MAGCRKGPQKNIIMVTLGTGVGGGIIIDGKPLVGAHGAGGEIGHLCVNYEETDHCGGGRTQDAWSSMHLQQVLQDLPIFVWLRMIKRLY